jgi:hypothetical protein
MAQPAKIFNQKIGFSGARPGEGTNYSDDFRTICRWHSPPIRDKAGRIVIHGIQAPAIHQRKGTHRISVHYSLIVGEIVPVFGEMYRVYEAEDRVKDTLNLRAAVEFVPKKDLPKGLDPIKADSFVVPLARFKFERTTVYDEWIELSEIELPKGKDEVKLKAHLVMGAANTPADRKATIQVGDVVLIGGNGFEVRGIVPADSKMQTAGWLELAQSFIPEADLVREKKAFIRPISLGKDGRD